MKNFTEQSNILALSLVPGIGATTVKRIITKYETASNAILQNVEELLSDKIISKKSATFYNKINIESLQQQAVKILLEYKKDNIKYVSLSEPSYPKSLFDINDPPPVLFYKGNLPLETKLKVAVVGSRKASFYGKQNSEKIGKELSSAGITVVSGGAYGIDMAALKGAVDAGGSPVVVLGVKLNEDYPSHSIQYLNKIEKQGCIVSELFGTLETKAYVFSKRNRIISGLSNAVVVIQAAEKSGSLITANYALKQNKQVFAMPYGVNEDLGKGANYLIRKGCKLFRNSNDIVKDMKYQIDNGGTDLYSEKNITDKDQKNILNTICNKTMHVDEIIQLSGISAMNVNKLLLDLELEGMISALVGNFYVKS